MIYGENLKYQNEIIAIFLSTEVLIGGWLVNYLIV